MKRITWAILGLALALSPAMTGCAAFQKGTLTHKVTASQHSFLSVVQAFQDAEIAEHQKGFVPDDLHIKIQQGIQKVALGGRDLDNALAAGADAATIKAKLDAIYGFLDAIANDGVAGIKNPTTKATLEVALDGIKAIIDNALVQVQ